MVSLSSPGDETAASQQVRHGAAYSALVALPCGAIAAMAGHSTAASLILVGAYSLPFLVMITHINLTKALTASQKAVWRRELWWGFRSMVAVWRYLVAKDLSRATATFGPVEE